MSLYTPFGKLMRKIRIDRNMRIKDLAEAVGVSAAYVSNTERAGMYNKRPSLGYVKKVAVFLQIDENELIRAAGIEKYARPETLKRIAERTALYLDVQNHTYHSKHPDYRFITVTCGHNVSWSRNEAPDKCAMCLRVELMDLLERAGHPLDFFA